MTLLAEDLLLLLLDDVTGKPVVDDVRLDRALSGAVLLELALHERIAPAERGEQVRKGRFAVRNSTPMGDTLLDATLSRLAERPVRPAQAGAWC